MGRWSERFLWTRSPRSAIASTSSPRSPRQRLHSRALQSPSSTGTFVTASLVLSPLAMPSSRPRNLASCSRRCAVLPRPA